MAETANYGLYVEDDAKTLFVDWRTKLNASTDSAMAKIDSLFADKADKSQSIEITLSASEWSGNAAPYTIAIYDDCIESAEQNGLLTFSASATDEQIQAAGEAKLTVGYQKAGAFVVSAAGVKPTVDIPVCLIMYG